MQIVRLSQPVTFPTPYKTTCLDFLAQYWNDRRWQMEQDFGLYDLPLAVDDVALLERSEKPESIPASIHLASTYVAENLAHIARAAAGELDRDNGDMADEMYESCQVLAEHLFATPGLGASYTIPNEFWQAPIGQMVALAFIWLERDELITIAEAARIAGKTISTISSRVARGTLRSYPDPRSTNPQKSARLVRRSDVAP
jgi:hypothetical protein